MQPDKLYLGAAYYPEVWPPEEMGRDMAYMNAVGVNVVRMGEFAWSTMEPDQDKISLDYFVDVIGKLYARGIDTIFCTPTPTPPIWLSHQHPERMFRDAKGLVMSHGARQHPCTNNTFFRERTQIITEAIAKAIGRLPGVIGWQTDNEFKCHVAECCCDECRWQWHVWLEGRYGTIDALNDAWGTAVWSQHYQRFDQVVQPVVTTYVHNPSLTTAYRIFSFEKIAEYQKGQIDIIRKYSDAPITHNSCRWFSLDNELMFRDLDFAAYDFYYPKEGWPGIICEYDYWRNVKKGRAFWVMENTTSHTGALDDHINTLPPAFVEAEAVSAYASGAEGFSFWCWRQQRAGMELTTGAIVSVWGEPTVGYAGAAGAARAKNLCETHLRGSRPQQAEVAITYSDRARAFCKTEPQRWPDYLDLMNRWHEMALDLNVHRDLIPEGGELAGYKLFLTPYVPYLAPELFARGRAFVEAGGTWIVGPLTGSRTAEHTIPTDAGLGELEDYAGVKTVFTYFLDGTGAVGEAFGASAPLEGMSAVFEARDAKAVGVISGGLTPGLGFLTERSVGRGKIVLLGAMPSGAEGRTLLQAVFQHYADESGVTLRTEATRGTVAFPRESANGPLWVVVNMDGAGGEITLPADATDLVSGEAIRTGGLALAPYAYRFLQFEPKEII